MTSTTIELARQSVRRSALLMGVALVLLAGIYVRALWFTPVEAVQGLAQKIFYIHPPAAYAMQLAFILTGIASALYLWLRDARLDAFAEASTEVAMVLGLIVVITGPIWGKPVWGTWWEWEPRLTFTVLQLLVFAGYFALRSSVREPAERAKFAAIVGITALVLVPFNHLTVYLFASQHPQPVVVTTNKPQLPWEMLRTFIGGFLVFTVLYFGLVTQRYGIGVRRMLAEALDA
jgi:heme exporter protein C